MLSSPNVVSYSAVEGQFIPLNIQTSPVYKKSDKRENEREMRG
jgi:hypothetical protein